VPEGSLRPAGRIGARAAVRTAARLAVLGVVVLLGLVLPKLFFDDAYITFRYAANIASGGGFCYNPPERVLGVTTPLFTLLLAAASRCGFSIEGAALLLGLAGHAALCLAVLETARALLPRSIAWPLVAALACAAHPHLAFTAVGGMETSLYCALLLAVLLAASEGRSIAAGLLGGLALLTRPDAIVVLVPAAWILLRSEGRGGVSREAGARRILASIAAAAVVAAPWHLFAWSYFGSPIPHSIAAKRMIHESSPSAILAEFGRFLLDDPWLIAAAAAALWTVASALSRKGGASVRKGKGEPNGRLADPRDRLAVALGAFVILYLILYAGSGVAPFPWYVNPLIPPCFVLAAPSLAALADRSPGSRRGVPIVLPWIAAAVVLGSMIAGIARQAPGLRDDWRAWEGAYRDVAAFVLRDSRPGESVYVGEVGVVGFGLPGRIVLDSSGINSPQVSVLRRGRLEEDPEWSREIVRRLRPDYVATSIEYLNIRTLAGERWFRDLYEVVTPGALADRGQVVFRRRH